MFNGGAFYHASNYCAHFNTLKSILFVPTLTSYQQEQTYMVFDNENNLKLSQTHKESMPS